MKKLLAVLVLASTLTLGACATTHTVTVEPTKIPAAVAPTPQPLTMRDVQWKVLTKADLEVLLQDLNTNPNPNFALYTLDNGNFQALNLNLVEIRRFILEQQQVTVYYKDLEASEHPVEEPAAPKKKRFFGLF